MRLPILRGPLRGWWWSPWSGGKPGRVLGGSYERLQTRWFEEAVRPGSCVFDLGAHVGYYTLLAARCAGERGRVVAVEPNPRNVRHLREHLRLNRVRNVEVIEAAIGHHEGVAPFVLRGSGTGHIGSGGEMRVALTTVDAICARDGRPPDVIKMDLEGGEVPALHGARETLASVRPVLFLSLHGAEPRRACLEILAEAGYRMEPIDAPEVHVADELICLPHRDA